MPAQCPACKKTLYLRLEKTRYMNVLEVGMFDVIPGEVVDDQTVMKLECMECGWLGWTEEYHDEKEGLIRMSTRRKDK